MKSAVCALVLLAGCAAGCSTPGAAPRDAALPVSVAAHVTVGARAVPGLGVVLTDEAGRVLYLFAPDARRGVSCTGPCAGTWPPLVIADGSHPGARGGVSPSRLGTVPDPNSGARVVSYGGYPLYRYAGDLTPGTANGQGLFSDGGPWYALDRDARPVTAPATGAR